MASTSCKERADALLGGILAGLRPDLELAKGLAQDDCSDALFRIVVEDLADRFEPRLCDAYAELFSEVIAACVPGFDAAELLARYNRVRVPRVCRLEPERVFVLSRVTLGADIAVTSVLLDAAKRRFPKARITLVGSAKIAELWAGDARVDHIAAPYPRSGQLADRLRVSTTLRELLERQGSIVLDPDSRLTQLGLVPVCEEENYFFFESRAAGGDTEASLPELAQRWCEAVLGVSGASPYVALENSTTDASDGVAVSFGVGENPAKALGPAFEAGLLNALSKLRCTLRIDAGVGGEEAERVRSAVAASGVKAEILTGSFAEFAACIAGSSLYVGYDSAGQHAAAALAVPLVTVFAGHVSERMFQRWKPTGRGRRETVNAEEVTPEQALQLALAAAQRVRTL